MATATNPRKTTKSSKTPKRSKVGSKAESKATNKPESKKPEESVSGSDAIRQTLKSGTTKSADLIAAVKEKFGLDVSLSLVGAIKGKEGYSKKRRKKRGRKSAEVATNDHADDKVSLASLIAAKKLVDGLGGVDKARAALNVLAKLA